MSGRALHGLTLDAPHSAWTPLPPPSRLCVTLASLAVVIHLTVSTNLLLNLHIPYNVDGGNPIVKFHPATYVAFAALGLRLFGGGRPVRTLEQLAMTFPRVMVFLAMIVLCMLWVVIGVGVSGVAVYVESYFSAGVLFLVLADASLEQRRRLGWVMMGLFVFNAVIATGETALHRTIMPFYLGADVYHMLDYEFRGVALYSHPLTGAMITEMAVLLLAQMRLSPRLTAALGLPLMLALISFGGRTALLVTMLTVILIGGYFMVRGVMDRTIRPIVILGAIVGVVVVAVLLWVIVTQTSIGVRLAGKLTLNDNSSQTRNFQWLVPGLMTTNQLLFGMSLAQANEYVYQIGLVHDFHIVENFWLVGFMYLGSIGFSLYLFGFFAFLTDLWRCAPLFGRAILVTTILVASTSTSIAQKSNVLFVMVACIVSSTGFARTQAARERGARKPEERISTLSGLRPSGGGLLRTLEPTGGGAAVDDLARESPPREHPPAGLGGLLRVPITPDRALRPLRPTVTRS